MKFIYIYVYTHTHTHTLLGRLDKPLIFVQFLKVMFLLEIQEFFLSWLCDWLFLP